MSEAPSAQTHAPTVYALPEHAHVELIQLRDHLRLMAQLTECGSNASRHDARLRPDALAWWFSRLSRDISAVVDATYFSSEVASSARGGRRGGRAAGS
ncbi:hypothetical protein LK996_12245 [Lysobacter sp. A6]|uniref:XAC0095-like domain-containing protein n=1 Tax=Noviluteimonas lactosilytica TaxID=2888523 RepID=A0ABS8JJR2_9GAMM|nr:hypothetical protein [Lysobacter lactosilyticus]MCC8363844.1 hypothetical protein [Lysobacter lactosilyticus]